MRTIKPYAFSFKSEAIWIMAFTLISFAMALLVTLAVIVVRWLH